MAIESPPPEEQNFLEHVEKYKEQELTKWYQATTADTVGMDNLQWGDSTAYNGTYRISVTPDQDSAHMRLSYKFINELPTKDKPNRILDALRQEIDEWCEGALN